MEDIKKTIEDLYEYTLSDTTNSYKIVDLWEIDADLAQRILTETGLNIEHFMVSLDTYSISHTLLKHGNPLKEALRGQIAVTKADFTKIVDIIQDADSIELSVKTFNKGIQKESLIFKKDLGDRFVVVKEIRRVVKKGKKNRLILQKMFIFKKIK